MNPEPTVLDQFNLESLQQTSSSNIQLPAVPLDQTPKKIPIMVSYANLDEKLIQDSTPEVKTVTVSKDTNQQGTKQEYHIIVLKFNYGLPNFPIVDEFYFEFCEVSTTLGLMSKLNAQGRQEHSILIKFDSTNKEHDKLIEAINRIHMVCVGFVAKNKGIVRMPFFNTNEPEGLFKNPVYRARDKISGELLLGRAPSMYLKCFNREGPYGEQTLFTGLDGKPIRWELLRSVEMKFIPLVHIKNIYCGGGKASLQMDISSAVVTDIKPRNGTSRQMDTIRNLQQSRPELVESVTAQIARMTMERQDQLLAADNTSKQQAAQKSSNSSQEQQSTFSGIVPTNQRQGYQPPQQPTTPQNYLSQQNYNQTPPSTQYQQPLQPTTPQNYPQYPQQNYNQTPLPQQGYPQHPNPQYPQQNYNQTPPPQQGYQQPPNMAAFTNSAPERPSFS